jgi:putative heme-binding domain-containing protein
MHSRILAGAVVALSFWGLVGTQADPPAKAKAGPRFQAPPGFVVEKVAGPPLVRYPLFAAFDDLGRLFVAEGTGTNLPGSELLKLKKQLGRILVLEDTDGDGIFDKSTVFADDLTFPSGVLWHDGVLYATSHPSLWRFEEAAGKGVARGRQALVSRFNFNGNGCDIHGPFLGPDGRLYWTDGRHGYEVKTREGKLLEGFASRIWRCRPDGSEIERVAGGGFDNPVELAFTSSGDLIGTMDQGPGDALLHYIEGGVYPMEHPCVKEFPMTGPLLGAVRQYTAALPVALCGLARYRSGQFGLDFQDSFFTAQFNVHRIEQHTLVRHGATFRSRERDFLTSTDHDVHFTDVLEDADGSLLVVDMGAWFNYGCPTSKIARPEVLGAIYRVRKVGAPAVPDPWGKSLDLPGRSPAELVKLLDDPRPKVRDQAVTHLAKRGVKAVPALATVLEGKGKARHPARSRRNAVWALCRMTVPEASEPLRSALTDPDAGVRQAAVHAVGLNRDDRALASLMTMAAKEEAPVRLKAAEALGRIGQGRAVPALLEALNQTGVDRFLEHALIYALIRINDRRATAAALGSPNLRVRQAGLIALDQMKDGGLTRAQVVPLLDTDDADVQQTVLAVMSRRPGWSREVLGLLRQWLGNPKLAADKEGSLTGAVLGFCAEAEVQKLVGEVLANADTLPATRLLLLRAVARCRLDKLPASWLDALDKALAHDDLAIRREAVQTVKARSLAAFDKRLAALAGERNLPAELRIAAFDCIAARQKSVPPEVFTLLFEHLSEKVEPLVRVGAARALGMAPLDRPQRLKVAAAVAQAGPMTLPLLAAVFATDRDPEVGRVLVAGLQRAPGAEALGLADLERLLAGYPAVVRKAAQPLRDRLAARHKDQAAFLVKLATDLEQRPADGKRGREVFFSRKVGCSSCHRVSGGGGNVGPDLSQVGRFRSRRDLLESIVYPSSSIVPEFRTFVVHTRAGKVVQGMIVRESSEAIYLRTPELAEIRLPRADVEDMAPSNQSLMPDGLDRTMSRQELGDLVEFLVQQK